MSNFVSTNLRIRRSAESKIIVLDTVLIFHKILRTSVRKKGVNKNNIHIMFILDRVHILR